MENKLRYTQVLAVVLGGLMLGAGCMTPARAVRESNAAAEELATRFWQEQTGTTNRFDVSRPADALTMRVALLAALKDDEAVVFPRIPQLTELSVSNQVLRLSLTDALCVAARNDRQYQSLKESIFLAALELDSQQHAFATTFSGLLLALFSGDSDPYKVSGGGGAGVAKKLESGAEFAANLAVDVVQLLRDDWRSLRLNGDLTMAVPLLRGAGHEVVREPLTQAERNLQYATQKFEYYRQTYAVSVAQAYFRVLETIQRVQNAEDNEKNLADNSRRAEMMFKAGRMDRIQVDQAQTDLLSANRSVIDTRKNYEVALDALKVRIGLPPEAQVEVVLDEIEALAGKMEQWAQRESAIELYPAEWEACEVALLERRDLCVRRSQVEDAARAVKIARDGLRADLRLTGGVHLDRARTSGSSKFAGNELWDLGAQFDLPWNRRRERNYYRRQMMLWEQTQRDLELQEDLVKQAVRDGLRNLVAARASYVNQREALKVARLRVESNALFLQSGRASMRDVLEAQQALLAARNALSSVMISWQMSDLELRRDMGVLKISEAGMWFEVGEEDHG